MKNYQEYEGRPVRVGNDHGDRSMKFDLLAATAQGLLDDLVPGSELCEEFLKSDLCEAFLAGTLPQSDIGQWFHYPSRGSDIPRFAPEYWHKVALLTRNSTLLREPCRHLSWVELRRVFDPAVIAVSGCSVGSNVAHAVVRDLRPGHLKVADPKEYHLTNANRVHLSYEDFGKNKAAVTALQIHSADPYQKISVYSEGVHEGNLNDFLIGDGNNEPRSSVVIEECDDPDIKIKIREAARKAGIPVVMVTDLGSAVQLDVRRYDRDRYLPIAACTKSDEELYAIRDLCKKDPARENFYKFVHAIIGNLDDHVPEFQIAAFQKEPPIFGGVPQLGSTAMMAGGVAAEAVARLLLGFELRERMFINKFTGQCFKEGASL